LSAADVAPARPDVPVRDEERPSAAGARERPPVAERDFDHRPVVIEVTNALARCPGALALAAPDAGANEVPVFVPPGFATTAAAAAVGALVEHDRVVVVGIVEHDVGAQEPMAPLCRLLRGTFERAF
jgi:hypothetical protein